MAVENYNYQKTTPIKVTNSENLPARSFLARIAYKSLGLPFIDEKIMKFDVYSGLSSSTTDTILFQLPPENIREEKSASFEQHQIMGRFEPVRVYAGSSPTSISFSINYYWMSDDKQNASCWDNLKLQIWKLKALTYPSMQAKSTGYTLGVKVEDVVKVGRVTPPAIIKFTYGDIYKDVQCLVKSVNLTYHSPWNDKIRAQDSQVPASGSTLSSVAQFLGISLPGFGAGGTDNISKQYDVSGAGQFFPFRTEVNISLETTTSLADWKTYDSVVGEITNKGSAASGRSAADFNKTNVSIDKRVSEMDKYSQNLNNQTLNGLLTQIAQSQSQVKNIFYSAGNQVGSWERAIKTDSIFPFF